ncbi:hypothetical protein AVEN_253995-1 [Araneus ventricosus]|uniref:Uncharacterized protein n=1 Tax=Araneus ventricosus TaxID=182803 RepID=A0A4Y2WV27_ARAVE|nr:hypothetical protein AVEN_253995-1 [Araneus ventricosus]
MVYELLVEPVLRNAMGRQKMGCSSPRSQYWRRHGRQEWEDVDSLQETVLEAWNKRGVVTPGASTWNARSKTVARHGDK